MNREEALIHHDTARHFGQDKDTYGKDIITAIYNDFESRTCDNCKWNNSNKHTRNCSLIGYTRYKDFGCNKFERNT